MIDGDKAIEYLKNKLINLINQGIIKATYEESENTISFYISDIVAANRPLLSLRLSNHHENFRHRNMDGRTLPQGDDNLSIELYKPNEWHKNKVRTNVNLLYHTLPKPEVIPFSVTTIEYRPWLMGGNDVNLIYQSILNWIKSKKQGAVYIDPLANTSRRATIETHQANITPRRYVTQAEKNFYLRYGLGDNIEPRYDIVNENKNINCNRNMNKKLIRLTESDLHRIVKESVNKVLNEMDDTDYRKARRNHLSLMQKVDPRTFANRARGVNAQGRPRKDDKSTMQVAAIDAWNDKYSKSTSNYDLNEPAPSPSNYERMRTTREFSDSMHNALGDDPYRITRGGIERFDDGAYNGYDSEYNPYTDTSNDSSASFNRLGKKTGESVQNNNTNPALRNQERYRVARQMAQGNGKYNPNKGWQ